MPIKNKYLFLVVTAGLLLGGLAEYVLNKTRTGRIPASIAKRNLANPKQVLAMGKQERIFTVQLVNLSGTPDVNEKELHLQAIVTLSQAVPNDELFYSWSLPAGAEIVSGHESDSLPHILPGQTAKVEMTLTGVSLEDVEKHVIFEVYYHTGGNAKISSSAVYSTQRNDEQAQLPNPVVKKDSATAPTEEDKVAESIKTEEFKMPKVHMKQ